MIFLISSTVNSFVGVSKAFESFRTLSAISADGARGAVPENSDFAFNPP